MEQVIVQKMRTKIARSKYREILMACSFPKFNVEYVTKIAMSKWIDFSIADQKAMIQRVVTSRNIHEGSAEKGW